MSAAKNNLKTQYKKGQPLYKAGDRADRVFILQQGLVAITAPGMKGAIELFKAVQPQLLGEEALLGKPFYTTTATAINDTAAIEIPVAQAKALVDGSASQIKQLAIGLLAKQTTIGGELLSIKREAEAIPCPPEKIAKLFTVIHQIAAYTGTKKDDVVTVTWPSFKKYCQRIFLESPVRLEQAMYMLVNLNLAQLEMVQDETDPEAPEDLGFIHFRNLEQIQSFAANPQGAQFTAFMEEIDQWNKNGLPKGMPEPVDPNAKFPPKPKKKAS